MRIIEILFWSNGSAEGNRSDLQLGLPPPRFNDDPTNLANAFTRRGLVKHFWNLNGSGGQPSGPTPREAGTELIPSGAFQPTTASWQAEPGRKRAFGGLHRLVPSQHYGGVISRI